MCRAIVIANDIGSAKRLLANRLGAEGIKVVSWVRYCELHQAIHEGAEVAILNTVGINGNENTIAAMVSGWHLPLIHVVAKSKGNVVDISKVIRWLGGKEAMKTQSKTVEAPVEAEVVEPVEATAPTSKAIVLNGWHMEQFEGDPEPRILDIVLAERLGFDQPRSIRKLIKRLDESGKIPGVLHAIHMDRIEKRGAVKGIEEREVTAYYLDERNALRVIRRCETDKADDIMDEVIAVYLAYRHGPTKPIVEDDDSLVMILAKHTDAKIASLSAKLANVDNLATNLLTEQERIEREAKERDEATQLATEEAIRKAKMDLYESVATRKFRCPPRPSPDQIPMFSEDGTKVMGDQREADITAIRRQLAFECARELTDEPDPRLITWADGLAQSWTRSALDLKGKMVMQSVGAYYEIKVYLRDKKTKRGIIEWMQGKPIPHSYLAPADWAMAYCKMRTQAA